jgi:hypothetical protein
MGSELRDVLNAIALFASGKHPDYPEFQNSNLINATSSNNNNNNNLYQGRWTVDPPHVYQLWQDGTLVASGDSQVVELIQSHTICGIQDDYLFWKAHGFEPWAGKPVWIPNDPAVHHILFDDNIHNLQRDGIATVRRQLLDDNNSNDNDHWETLTSLEILKQHGKHLVRTPTIEPALNKKWFLERIDEAIIRKRRDDDTISKCN